MDVPLLIAMVILIALSGFFSASETAFSTANRMKLKTLAQEKNKRAKLVLALTDNYPKLISTILVGNNIVNITLSSIATLFFIDLIDNSSAATAVSTAVITVVVLVFGEVSPKTLAKESPEKFAMFAAGFMKVMTVLLTPVNFLFDRWNKLLLRLFRIERDAQVTEEDLLNIVNEAQSGGGIGKDESTIIRSAIEFNDLDVQDVLTPRVDVVAASITDGKDEVFRLFRESGFSRLPVYKGTVDNILGVINQKDFYEQVMLGKRKLRSIIAPAKMVTPYMKISDLMKVLQRCKTHMAVVIDEYGGTLGIVTLEDILEELVGEIWDEHDEVTEDVVRIDENTYRVNGGVSLFRLFSMLGVDEDDEDEDDDQPSTVAGLIMREAESIPEKGEEISYKNLRFKIEEADEAHVETVLVTLLPEKEEEE